MRGLSTSYEIKQRFEESRSGAEGIFLESREKVFLAHVFRSIASGNVGKLSDIDFGVYFGEEVEEGRLC